MDNIKGDELARVLANIWTEYEDKLTVAEQLALSFAIAAVHYCENNGLEFTIEGVKTAVVEKQD